MRPQEFIDQIKYLLDLIHREGRFEEKAEASFFNHRDEIIDKCKERVEFLKAQNQSLSDNSLKQLKQNHFLEGKIKTLCAQFDQREAQISDLEAETVSIRDQLREEQAKRIYFEKKVLQTESDLHSELATLRDQNKQLEEKNRALKLELIQAQSLSEDAYKIKEQIENQLNHEKKKSLKYQNESLEVFQLKNQNSVYLKKIEELQAVLDKI